MGDSLYIEAARERECERFGICRANTYPAGFVGANAVVSVCPRCPLLAPDIPGVALPRFEPRNDGRPIE